MRKVVWIVRGIKDYRIPVYYELSVKDNIDLHIIYNKYLTKESVYNQLSERISQHQISKELIYGPKDNNHGFANKSFKITYIPGLYKVIKFIKPDVIITEGFFQYSFYAFIYKIFNSKTKIVVSYERTKYTERSAQLVRIYFRKMMLKLADSVICNGILSEEYVRSLGFNRKIYLGNMTVDVFKINEKSKSLKGYNVKCKKVSFLYIGLLTKRKGLIELFNVWKEFENIYGDNIELKVIGSGDSENVLKSYIVDNSIKSIKMFGQIDYELLPEFMGNSDILINPTLEDNWSLVVPEAMAGELPILTTYYNGLYPDLVKESNGWIFDILNYPETLNILIDVYKRRESLHEMGKASFEIIKNYTPFNISENFYNAAK